MQFPLLSYSCMSEGSAVRLIGGFEDFRSLRIVFVFRVLRHGALPVCLGYPRQQLAVVFIIGARGERAFVGVEARFRHVPGRIVGNGQAPACVRLVFVSLYPVPVLIKLIDRIGLERPVFIVFGGALHFSRFVVLITVCQSRFRPRCRSNSGSCFRFSDRIRTGNGWSRPRGRRFALSERRRRYIRFPCWTAASPSRHTR